MSLFPIFIVLILSNIVETVVGFAGTIVALTLGSYFFDLKELMIILLPLNFILNSTIVYKNRKDIDYKTLWTIVLIPMVLGVLLSFPFQNSLDSEILKKILGFFILLVFIKEMIFFNKSIHIKKQYSLIFSTMAGIIHGLLTTGGPLVVICLTNLIHNKRVLRNTLSAVWMLMSAFMISLYFIEQKFTSNHLQSVLFLLITIPIGHFVGEKILNRVSDILFKKIVLGLLFLIALNLIF